MTREQVEQAKLYGSILLSTEAPGKEFRVFTFHGHETSVVILCLATDKTNWFQADISTLSIKPRASTFCQISCGPGDHKVGGKCYYMGCVSDDKHE